MPAKTNPIVAGGLVWAALLGSAGCAPKPLPPPTVSDLMEDRVALDGVLIQCNEDPAKARTRPDCLNARIAVERLAREADPAEQAKREAEFEVRRDRLRAAQEKLRQEQEERSKVDPYAMPVAPVDATSPPAAPAKGASEDSRAAVGAN